MVQSFMLSAPCVNVCDGLNIPPTLFQKAVRFPESSYGATTVTLVLKDGRRTSSTSSSRGDEVVVKGRCARGALTFERGDQVAARWRCLLTVYRIASAPQQRAGSERPA